MLSRKVCTIIRKVDTVKNSAIWVKKGSRVNKLLKHHSLIKYVGGGLVIVAIVMLATVNAHAIKNQLNDWKLLPQPERLTELYFTNPNNLPSTYNLSLTQQFGFTVHNLEYRNTDYSYQVLEQNSDDSQTITLQQGSFWLKQNQFKTVNENINLNNLGSRVKVIVNLSNINESIDYWSNWSNT